MYVKMCGMMSEKDVQAANVAQADMVGFVFAPSKREISVDLAKQLAKEASSNLKKVGVFVNETVDYIHDIAARVGLDYVQLHGDETADFVKQIQLPVIKAFSIDEAEVTNLNHYHCDYFLIDSPGQQYRGGSGKAFNWQRILELKLNHKQLILAGGLTSENVFDAIQQVKPFGVDVSSGIESEGVKDPLKMRTFIEQAKQSFFK
ncbi:MAG TPA: phosphoribosylanthranilate isomerase [Pseudogracilibacillus sp.]|nr:phosphoribosylanthranilate isomerase [Pseudogracilibacillus sp.]